MLLISSFVNADAIAPNTGCSYGAPISAVYKQVNGTWIIQVYGGINAVGGSDLVVDHSQLIFKGIKGTKSLTDFKLGWEVEDKGFSGFSDLDGRCNYTKNYLESLGLEQNPVYIIKK